MLIWEVEAQVQDLKHTRELLKHSRYPDNVSMSNLVNWEDMKHAKCVGKGPGEEYVKTGFSWLSVLRVLIEVILIIT